MNDMTTNLSDLIIAHRGASFDAPENTLAAIRQAWSAGIKAVEVDVHLTKDNEVAVIHDASTKRTTSVNSLVIDQTMHDLKQLDAGSWKDESWVGEQIPRLTEVLATIPEGGKLIIEIKGPASMTHWSQQSSKQSC